MEQQEHRITEQVLRHNNGVWLSSGEVIDRVQRVDSRFIPTRVKKALDVLMSHHLFEKRGDSASSAVYYRYFDPALPISYS